MRLNTPMVDRVMRAMTDDGSFRLITARTTDTVSGAIEAQSASGSTAVHFANLLTAVVLYRETMAPTLRVQSILTGSDKSSRIITDSHPEGWSRGLVQSKDKFSLGDGAILEMMRSLPNGELHRGIVPFEESVSKSFAFYMENSEQVTSVVAVDTVIRDGKVIAAGGYLVQLLPEAPEHVDTLAVLTQRLEDDFQDIAERLEKTDANPEHLIGEIFWGMPHTMLGDSNVRFDCNCSRARVMAGLSTIGRDDIQSFIDDGETLDLSCDYCNKSYLVDPQSLKGLLESS